MMEPRPVDACVVLPVITPDDRDHPTLAVALWSPAVSVYEAVQVYIDGELFDVATRPGTDRMLLRLDRGVDAVIEMIVVCAVEPWTPRPAGLSSYDEPPVRTIALAMSRDAGRLPPYAGVGIAIDGVPIGTEAIWPADAARPGFGVQFGHDDFGHGMAVGVGFGAGELGSGPFGSDGTLLRAAFPIAGDAPRLVSLVLLDRYGNPMGEPEERVVMPHRVPASATTPQPGGGFHVTWTWPD
jgi:hypothetical protein